MPKRKTPDDLIPDLPPPRPREAVLANEYARFCKQCGDLIQPGEGFIYRYREMGAYRLSWRIWHPDCRGKPIWLTHTIGWIYAASGCGPNGDMFKVGMTFKHPRERVGDIAFVRKYMPTMRVDALNPLWVSATEDRVKAERGLHALLQPYRADKSEGLGREVYRCDLLTVQDAMLAVTGSAPTQIEWQVMENSGTYFQKPYDHAEKVRLGEIQRKHIQKMKEFGDAGGWDRNEDFQEWCRKQDAMKPDDPT